MTTATIERSDPRTTTLDVLEAIRTRRSTGMVRQDLPPREAIEQILEAASWVRTTTSPNRGASSSSPVKRARRSER